jgi:hypothetical protein
VKCIGQQRIARYGDDFPIKNIKQGEGNVSWSKNEAKKTFLWMNMAILLQINEYVPEL